MEYFIQYTSNREAEYVTIDYVSPIKQVDHYPITVDCVKSTIRDFIEAVLRSAHMFWSQVLLKFEEISDPNQHFCELKQ